MSCCPSRAAGGASARAETAASPVAVRSSAPTPARCVLAPGGRGEMGTRRPIFPMDGEGPPKKVRLKPFRIDPYAVTNSWFADFVAATGYVTDAERFGWSMVFHAFIDPALGPTQAVVGAEWWRKVDGASWRAPEGPGSSVEDRGTHPVVHVSWRDATALAAWAGGRLPTEAEWEVAAKAGRDDARYPWGDAEPDAPSGDAAPLCNIWRGRFPDVNTAADGYAGTAPVDAFAPNRLGLHNMAGNVWEWCADPFRIRTPSRAGKAADAAALREGKRVTKGGSYLCHRSYCWRYRIAARTGVTPDSSTGHLGFRLVWDAID